MLNTPGSNIQTTNPHYFLERNTIACYYKIVDGQPNSKQLIDQILYLASLASDPQSVDLILDRLRVITAVSTQLSPRDITNLQSIEIELRDHLLHKERFRSFTPDSLQANIEQHFAGKDPLRDARRAALKRIIITIVLATAITGALVGFRLMEGQVILAFYIFTLFVGLASVFQSIKKSLVAQLHDSLNYLMAAVIGNGLFALNFPVIAANSHLQSLSITQHGGFLIGAVPVYLFYYLAFYLYAKQLGVTIPRILKPGGVVLSVVVVTAVSILAPHPVAVPDELSFDLSVIGFAVSVYLSGIAAVLGFMAVPKTTAVYSKSTLFLAVSMVLETLGNGFFLVFVTFISGDFMVNDQKGQVFTAFLIMIALACQYIAAYRSKASLA
jgi:hypothetical protein